MVSGYVGKILFVDLTTGKLEDETPPENLYREYIGGNGIGVRILYERMKPKADPLGPDNILGFVTGPLTATPTSGSGRYSVVAKSPLTGGWAEANSGGFWGPELKWAGYDAVFITGASPKPVYIFISGGKAEIRDAAHLWGKDTSETEDKLNQELGSPRVRVACIGPSGESRSLMAGIVNDKGRIAARSGVGAVMGSKNLKAVVVRGNKKKIPVAQQEKFTAAREEYIKRINASPMGQLIAAMGTGSGTSMFVSLGDTPTKNWNTTGTDSLPTANKLDTPNMEKYKISGYGCQACPMRCGAILQIKEGPFATRDEVHRPEYETIAALGTCCNNDNAESVIKANELCNLYGLDTIATGNAVSFALECYEKGIITRKDTGGLDLTWGNARALVDLVDKIGKREGFGDVLADGAIRAARRIGKGSEQYALHIGGFRLPYHDPRLDPAKGTSYIADAQPASHAETYGSAILESGNPLGADPVLQAPKLAMYGDYDKKGPMFVTGAAYFQLVSCSGLCSLYTVFIQIPVAELIAPLAGWDFNWAEALKAGRRILTLRQAFNAREGLVPSDFQMPKRFLEPLAVGPATGARLDFETMKVKYFEAMGWDIKSGKPFRKTLVDLDLDELTKDL